MVSSGRPPKRNARPLASEEEWLWSEVTKDVLAFRPRAAPPQRAPKTETANASAKNNKPAPAVSAPRRPAIAPVGAQLGSGVDGGTARRLAQGRLAPEAVLDLHGMTQDHAHLALERFLAISVAHGRRCVLVITGKGGPSQARDEMDAPWARRRPGVLKSLVPLWLEHSGQRDRIAAIRAAHLRHGGGGALYVYLRRA